LLDGASIALLLSSFLLSLEPVAGYQTTTTTSTLFFRPNSSTHSPQQVVVSSAAAAAASTGVAATETTRMNHGTMKQVDQPATKQPATTTIRLRLPFAPPMIVGHSDTAILQRRHSNSAAPASSTCMFLSCPASKTRNTLRNVPIQQQQQQPVPAAQFCSNQARVKIQESTLLPNNSRRNRGVLGFRIHSLAEEEAAQGTVPAQPSSSSFSGSTRLNMRFTPPSNNLAAASSRKTLLSKVDPSSWNLPEPLSLEAAGAYASSSSSTSSSSSSRPVTAIPWIPSDDDVASLTVVQLKTELQARGLKKTGRKADLQQRMREWTEHQQQRRSDSSGSGSGSSGGSVSS